MKWAAGCPVNILDELTYTVYEEFLGGLSGTYSIQDSILYLKRLDIKYFDWDYEHVGCVAPAPLSVPLNVVFKENNSDSIKATFFSDYLLFVCIDCYPENDSNARTIKTLLRKTTPDGDGILGKASKIKQRAPHKMCK